MITQEKISEILAQYPEKKPTALNYAKVREDLALLAAGAARATQGAEGMFPCKPGDTVFFIDKVDCFECPHVGVCPGVTHGGRGAATPKPITYVCPFEVVECEVDSAEFIYDEDGLYFRVNNCYEFIEPDGDIFFDRAGAEAQLNDLESAADRKCRICGCTWESACLRGCYWVEEDLCSRCVDESGVADNEKMEVVGNIHDNPELLEG